MVLKDNLHETVPGMYLKFSSMNSDQAKPDESHPSLKPKLMVCQKPAKCEAVDDEPQIYFDAHGCESSNVTLNRCVAKNGACSSEMHDQEDRDNGFYTGVSALWDSHHVVCCTLYVTRGMLHVVCTTWYIMAGVMCHVVCVTWYILEYENRNEIHFNCTDYATDHLINQTFHTYNYDS